MAALDDYEGIIGIYSGEMCSNSDSSSRSLPIIEGGGVGARSASRFVRVGMMDNRHLT